MFRRTPKRFYGLPNRSDAMVDAMRYLYCSPHGGLPYEIADFYGKHSQDVHRTLKKLYELGLVERNRSKIYKDGSHVYTLKALGHKALQNPRNAHFTIVQYLLDAFAQGNKVVLKELNKNPPNGLNSADVKRFLKDHKRYYVREKMGGKEVILPTKAAEQDYKQHINPNIPGFEAPKRQRKTWSNPAEKTRLKSDTRGMDRVLVFILKKKGVGAIISEMYKAFDLDKVSVKQSVKKCLEHDLIAETSKRGQARVFDITQKGFEYILNSRKFTMDMIPYLEERGGGWVTDISQYLGISPTHVHSIISKDKSYFTKEKQKDIREVFIRVSTIGWQAYKKHVSGSVRPGRRSGGPYSANPKDGGPEP